jgi:hypothetical protein
VVEWWIDEVSGLGVAFHLEDGRCPARTWRSLIGGGVRRVCPGGREQEGERGCARGSMVTGRAVWRGDREGGSRSARRDDAKAMPARCSTQSRLPEHG